MIISDLRQGYYFSKKSTALICSLAVDLKPVLNDAEECIAVVISQDCDIAREVLLEPYIEFIIGRYIGSKLDGSLIKGKNPRLLQISDKEKTLEFSIHNKFRITKQDFDKITKKLICSKLDTNNLDLLKKWLAKRYTRAAFPDAFNERLKKHSDYKKLEKNKLSESVSYVLIFVTEEEFSDEQVYEPEIIVVVPESVDIEERVKIRDLYDKGFYVENKIDSDVKVLTEQDISIKNFRKFKRWDKDSCSISSGYKPADGVDTV